MSPATIHLIIVELLYIHTYVELIHKIYIDENSDYYQKYDESFYDNINITYLSENEMDEKKKHLVKPYNVFESHLHRKEIFKTESFTYLYLDIHHIISDGTSHKLLLKQIIDTYNDININLPKDYYFIFVDNFEKIQNSKEYIDAINKYQENYDLIKDDCSLIITPDFNSDDENGASYNGELNVDKNFNGNIVAKEFGGNVFFMCTYLISACIYDNKKNSYLTWVHSGRDTKEKNNSIGAYIKSAPLFGKIDENTNLLDFYKNVKEQINFSLANSEVVYYPSDLKKLTHQSVFIYQYNIFNLYNAKEILNYEIINDDNNGADSLFEFSLVDEDSRNNFGFEIEYSRDHYKKESIEKFVKIFNDVALKLLKVEDASSFKIKQLLQ